MIAYFLKKGKYLQTCHPELVSESIGIIWCAWLVCLGQPSSFVILSLVAAYGVATAQNLQKTALGVVRLWLTDLTS